MAQSQFNLPILTSQYAPSSAVKRGNNVADAAFQEAKKIFKADLAEGSKQRSWVDEQTSLEDVMKAVNDAASNYKAKSSGSSAAKWLRRLSARIQVYGVVLDVLVQHHPEYVSLAWGAFKLLFTAVVNHETLAKELSKALTRIAEILPQAEADIQLYPTAIMQDAVAQLYACLLRIAVKATRWFRQRRVSHAVGAIWRPWALEFESEVNEIQAAFVNVTSQASLAGRAELRDIHAAIKLAEAQPFAAGQRAEARAVAAEKRAEMAESTLLLIIEQIKQGREEFKDLLQAQQGIQQEVKLDLQNQRDVIQMIAVTQLSGLAFAKDLPSPGACLQYCLSFRIRSRPSVKLVIPDLGVLECWSRASTSSICALTTTSSLVAKNIVVAIVQVIRDSSFHVIWALRFSGFEDVSVTTVTILRMLVLQIIHRNQAVTVSGQFALTAQTFEEAGDERDWLQVLGRSLAGLVHVFVVMDAELLKVATNSDNRAAASFIERILGCTAGTVLKIFVPASSVAIPSQTDGDEGFWVTAKADERGRSRVKRLRQTEALSIRKGRRR